jgi:hypothetical protein
MASSPTYATAVSTFAVDALALMCGLVFIDNDLAEAIGIEESGR